MAIRAQNGGVSVLEGSEDLIFLRICVGSRPTGGGVSEVGVGAYAGVSSGQFGQRVARLSVGEVDNDLGILRLDPAEAYPDHLHDRSLRLCAYRLFDESSRLRCVRHHDSCGHVLIDREPLYERALQLSRFYVVLAVEPCSDHVSLADSTSTLNSSISRTTLDFETNSISLLL